MQDYILENHVLKNICKTFLISLLSNNLHNKQIQINSCLNLTRRQWKISALFVFGLDIIISLFTGIFLCDTETCSVPAYLQPVQILIILLNLCFMIKEMFQAYLDWSAYIRQWENWLQWLIILGVFLCTVRLISISYMTMGIYNSKL